MKFSQQWISEYVPLSGTPEQLRHMLTMAGLEVDSVEVASSLGNLAPSDHIFEIDITPNRGDCLSCWGVAREISVLTQSPFTPIGVKPIQPVNADQWDIQIKVPSDCPRYAGRIIKNINSGAKTPDWISERLIHSDIRCIHPVVDILNYVMLELGQPMHAFDLEKLTGSLVVRHAKDREKIKLLDEREISLKPGTLVIADQKQAQAVAGIMGGAESGVSTDTKHIFLESALFMPVPISGKARQYGMHTDSSFRFERGVDPEGQSRAIERATALILEICGGEPAAIQEVVIPDSLPKKQAINLRFKRLKQILGIVIDQAAVLDLLKRIGCVIQKVQSDVLVEVMPPLYRYDIEAEIDLIEEIARVYGYQNIPVTLPKVPLRVPLSDETLVSVYRIKQAMVDLGYQEVINYSFIDNQWQALLGSQETLMQLVNPISQDMNTMRFSLLPGLLKTLQYNQRRQQNRVMIFEVGNCYFKQGSKMTQIHRVAGLCFGRRFRETWRKENRPFDFYDVKGDLCGLWDITGQASLSFVAIDSFVSQKGQSAEIFAGEKKIGQLGKLDPNLLKTLDITGDVFWFECELDPFTVKKLPKFARPSKYPEIRRDLALLVDQKRSSVDLTEFVSKHSKEWIQNVVVFDEYKGKGLPESKKSIAIGLILQHPSRTLVDDEVNALMDNIIKGLQREFGAELRDN